MQHQFVKICGLKNFDEIETAFKAGANFIGYVDFPKSPRHLAYNQMAELSNQAADLRLLDIEKEEVLLMVDPDNETIEKALSTFKPDFIQLHGNETPERVWEIMRHFRIEIIKAIGISSVSDLKKIKQYRAAAAFILDAKPPKDAAHPGGLGQAFDWNILKHLTAPHVTPDMVAMPWMLSGGLTPENVGTAIRACARLPGFAGVDVSSGVESEKGVKNLDKIKLFISNAKAAMSELT